MGVNRRPRDRLGSVVAGAARVVEDIELLNHLSCTTEGFYDTRPQRSG